MLTDDYVLESERLGFRVMEERDLQDLIVLDTDPEVRAHFPDGISSAPEILKKIKRNQQSFADRGYCDFLLIHKELGRFAGRAGFGDFENGEVEVGYVLLKEFWGQGLAQETLKALLAWASKSITADRILAYAPVEHAASLNVMAKCGMTYLKTDSMRDVDCTFYEFVL